MEKIQSLYCNSLTKYSRYLTREVKIGDIPLGNNNPIRIQSMTTTNTMDTMGTVEQTIRMVNAGCEYVRITAPSKNEAENLLNIKNELRKRGYKVPLIADIHFTPNAAEIAARIVEKVRVNPGNYADKKRFEIIDYSDADYNDELEKIRDKFIPLIKICKEYGTALRIGTNHGSLSDRIMSRYGDTPLGMVESALEFVRICEEENFNQIVLSMKSSNPQVMVQAYRLLIEKMKLENMNYPLHLGVTEAGGGEDGRVKSALGIGTLLDDGIGDTIRVSLTEDPEFEAPAAKDLVGRYKGRENHNFIKEVVNFNYNPLHYKKRESIEAALTGNQNVPRVIGDFSKQDKITPKDLNSFGYLYNEELDIWNIHDIASDFIYLGNNSVEFDTPASLKFIVDEEKYASIINKDKYYPLLNYDGSNSIAEKYKDEVFLLVNANLLNDNLFNLLKNKRNIIIVLETFNSAGIAEQRRFFIELLERGLKNPVIIKRNYSDIEKEKVMLYSSTDLGALLIDGFGDGIWITYNTKEDDGGSFIKIKETNQSFINRLSFNILQAARLRISKTEYIACPSCGRTLFDLQDTTAKIRSKTSHLKGVKIAIMGCIVNGPGEMADADYGYVGSGVDKITLYKGKEILKRNIPFKEAVDELIEIIKDDGNWIDPL